jgi:hypothetical protein
MTHSERLITVNFEELFHHAEGYMMREDDICWALGMALLNDYSGHPIVYQLEDAMIKRVNEKAAQRKLGAAE